MKKSIKKIVSLGLAAGLVLASFAGCGGKQPAASAPVSEKSGIKPSDEFPISDEKIDLNVMASQDPNVTSLDDNDFTRYLEDKTNIHINWSAVPSTGAAEKLNITLSSGGTLPEVFMGFNINMSQQIALGDSQGLFVDMTPYLDTYGKNIKQRYDEDLPILKQINTTPSGKLFGLCNAEETYHTKFGRKAWINNDFMKKLNLEIPNTIDEFTDMLRKIKNSDPNGNGIADEIPLTGADKGGWNNQVIFYIMPAFVDYNYVSGVDRTIALNVKDGKIMPSFNTDEWKDGLKYMKSLIDEGLLDPLALTQDNNQLKTTVATEPHSVGVVVGGSTGSFSSTADIQEQYSTALQPLTGPKGHCYTYYQALGSTIGTYVISKDCKNVEAAVRLGDYFSSEEGTLMSQCGMQGRDWDYVKDDSVKGLNGKPAVYKRTTDFTAQTSSNWSKLAPQIMPDDLRNGMAVEDKGGFDIEKNLYDQTKKYETKSDKKYLLPLTLKEEYVSKFTDIQTTLISYLSQMTSQFITGVADIDSEWDNYINQLNSIGLDEFMKIINDSYTYSYGQDALK